MILRFARHTNRLPQLRTFYTEVLGFELTGEFKDHAGYNGIFLSAGNAGWHLEFTESEEPAASIFDADDLLVFYPETETAYNRILKLLETHKIKQVEAQNPYWNQHGITILDPDGYRIVISAQKITTSKI